MVNTEDYKLPVCDVDKEKRNFPGYKEEVPFTLDELREGDTSGTTDSDLKTHGKPSKGYDSGYTKIYSKGD